MAGAKGFVHGSILLCRPRNGDRRAQYPARRLYSKAENIEHADAVSATAVGAFSRGNRCFAVVRKPACAVSGKGTQSAEIPCPCAPFRCIEGSAGGADFFQKGKALCTAAESTLPKNTGKKNRRPDRPGGGALQGDGAVRRGRCARRY